MGRMAGRRGSRLGRLEDSPPLGNVGQTSTEVFLPIIVRNTAGNPISGKTFWLDVLPVPGGSNIPKSSGKMDTDDNGMIMSHFTWDGSTPVSGQISLTPLFSYTGGQANKAILWQVPVTWYAGAGQAGVQPLMVTLKPGGGITDSPVDVPAPAPVPPPSAAPTPSKPPGVQKSALPQKPASPSDSIDYWEYAGWAALGLAVLGVAYFVVLPWMFGEDERGA